MSLLSSKDKAEIRAAAKLVTDTFMVTPVVYELHAKAIDRWGEGETTKTIKNFSALVETPKGDMVETPDGSIDMGDVKLTVNLEDLEAIGMITADYDLSLVIERDYFTTRGRKYKVTDAYPEGPLDSKNVLVCIHGKLDE